MICKAQIDITILFDDQVVEPAFFEEATLADLERLMDDEAIGLTSLESITQLNRKDLEKELLALGNDGSFFDEC
jgi:hypothetical protein